MQHTKMRTILHAPRPVRIQFVTSGFLLVRANGIIGAMLSRLQLATLACFTAVLLAPSPASAQVFPLDSAKGLEPHGVSLEPVTYQGHKAIRVVEQSKAADSSSVGGIAILPEASFHDGTIEVDLAGKPAAGAPGDARGFVGIVFRANADATKYECVYLRPTNGRADDQLRRNHSTQYISIPEYEWFRLRQETPGKYESYVDLVPGEWTKLRIEVSGVKMRLFVNGSAQPVLVVNDLKHGDSNGTIALWIGPGTEAYFANLRVTH